jgi:hypothetical protein
MLNTSSRCPFRFDNHPQPHLMDAQQRLNRALQIREALSSLMTDDEADTYECLFDHLEDYIRDLGIDLGVSLPPL